MEETLGEVWEVQLRPQLQKPVKALEIFVVPLFMDLFKQVVHTLIKVNKKERALRIGLVGREHAHKDLQFLENIYRVGAIEVFGGKNT